MFAVVQHDHRIPGSQRPPVADGRQPQTGQHDVGEVVTDGGCEIDEPRPVATVGRDGQRVFDRQPGLARTPWSDDRDEPMVDDRSCERREFVTATDERRSKRGQLIVANRCGAQHTRRFAVDHQLLNRLRLLQILELVKPPILHGDPRRQHRHQLSGSARRHHLAAVGGRHQPRRAVDRRAEVVAVALVDLTGVDRHPDPDRQTGGPRLGPDRPLRLDGCCDCVGCTRERHGEAVSARGEDVARVACDRAAHEIVVAGEHRRHRGGRRVPGSGRSLDVAEQKRHRSRRPNRRGHHSALAAQQCHELRCDRSRAVATHHLGHVTTQPIGDVAVQAALDGGQ